MKIIITANSDAYPSGHPNETRPDVQNADDVALSIQAKYGLFSAFAKRNLKDIVQKALSGAGDEEISTFVLDRLKKEIVEDSWPIAGTPTKRAKEGRGAFGKGTRKGMSFRDTDTMMSALGVSVDKGRDVA